MGKSGIEEVEASYMDGDDDRNLDIDDALSYIDERIQKVLGHYKKDFEVGSSAEKLGARFGGYGSFLPMYQRSPNPRTKQKVLNHVTPISSLYFPSKDTHYSAVVSVEAQPLRPEPSLSIAPQMPLSRISSVDTSVNSQCSKDQVSKCNPVDLPMLQTDRKALKVRIKLGPESKLAQQNAAIYSGLGLGMSPYSSPEDSPIDWEEKFPRSQETLCESPSFIVKIMTSFPVPDGALLTPLHDCFVHIAEEKSLLVESNSGPIQEHSSYSKNEIASVNECKDKFGVKKIKLGGKKERLGEWNDSMDPVSVINAHHGKEIGSEKFKGKEISSNSLKFRLTPTQKNKASGLAEGTGEGYEANFDMARDRIISSNVAKFETAELVSSQRGPMTDKSKAETSLLGKDQKNIRVGLDLRQGSKAEEDGDLDRADCDNLKGFKDRDDGSIDPSRQRCDQKIASHFQDESKVTCLKELPFIGGETKSKGKLSSGGSAAGLSKGSMRDDFSMLPKKNLTHGSRISSRSEGADNGLHKGKDSYRVLKGNKKLGSKVNRLSLLENSAKDCAKDSNLEICGKENLGGFTNMSDERSGGKNDDQPLMPKAYVKGNFGCSALAGTGPNSEVLPTGVTPLVIQENWVCCDKCQQWRLLPHGSNPDDLPKKWKCRMLNWLPGMNRCKFSEEETTKALRALYIVPVGETQNNHQIHSEGAASQIDLADTQQLDQNQQGLVHIVPSGGKKKHDSKAVSNPRPSEPINVLESEKNVEASVKSLKNESQRSLELISEKISGDAKPSKMKRREIDLDECRVSTAKTDHMHCTDKDQFPGGLSMRESTIHNQNHPELSFSQDFKGPSKRGVVVSTKKQKNQVGSALVMDEHNKSLISGTKRKLKDWEDCHIHTETLLGNEHHYQENWIPSHETNGNKFGEEKASKESKLQEKNYPRKADRPDRRGEVSGSRDSPLDGKISEKERSLWQYEGNKCQLVVDGKNSVRRKLPMTVNSSSLKLSSSSYIKTNIQDAKGSPDESVSSSPMRFSFSDNFRRNLLRKGDALSPPLCSEDEDNGGSPQIETIRNDKINSDIHGKSLKSSSNHQDSVTEPTIQRKVDSSAGNSKFPNRKILNLSIDDYEPDNHFRKKMSAKKHLYDEERAKSKYNYDNGSLPWNSDKDSIPQTNEKHFTSGFGFDKGRIKISDSYNQLEDIYPMKNLQYEAENDYNGRTRDKKLKFERNKVEKNYADKGLSKGKQPNDSGRRETTSKLEGSSGKSALKNLSDANRQENERSNTQQNMHQISRGKRSSEWVSSKRTDNLETYSGTQNSQSVRREQGTTSPCRRPVPEFSRGDKSYILPVDVDSSYGGDAANATKQFLQSDGKQESHCVVSRHPTPKSHTARNTDAPIPIKKNFLARAAKKALREAKDLKLSADQLKVSGSGLESTELFFKAALKFLHGALLLEPCNRETSKYGEMTSAKVYTSTAKLCEYCAHEYERCRDMASAALAYKCVEVAYMRLIYSNYVIASRDRHELQMDLQMALSVESPSSSASDVDNVNIQAAVDVTHRLTDISTPPLPGNHVIPARNRLSFSRLLNFAQDVNLAMEASRKSLDAYAAGYVKLAEGGNEESISSVKRVLDFSFHDLEGLLHLIQLAMKALSS